MTVSADAVAGDISIHALVKRATLSTVADVNTIPFQSTPS